MKVETDTGAGGGRRLGLIVLSTDETLEFEARQVLAGRQANLMHARILSQPEVTPEALQTMAQSLTKTAMLLPADLAAIAYGCTSAATVIGPERVQQLVQKAHPGVPVTNPMSAVIAGLRALGASRIALVTPYVASVTAPMRAHLLQHGIEVVSEISFAESDDRKVARISEATTRAAMLDAGRAEGVEAIFVSCTNLRSFAVIDVVEAALDLPVISSNQALIWHLLHLAGIKPTGWGPGRLYQRGIAD
jgi:maleate isomerase